MANITKSTPADIHPALRVTPDERGPHTYWRPDVKPAAGASPSTKQRLLVVTRHYAPEPVGSAPPMHELARWFACDGMAVEVVTVRPSYPCKAILSGYAHGEHDSAVEDGVNVLRFPTQPVTGPGLLARLGPEATFMLRLWAARLMGTLKPCANLVSLCPSILTVVGALALRQAGGRHVAVVHDIPSGLGGALGGKATRLIIPVLKALEAWTLNRVDGVIVLSQEMADQLRRIGVRTQIAIQPPMVDAASVTPREADEAPDLLTLMYSGNLGRKQGLGQLIELAQTLQRRGARARIVLRGEGAISQELAQEIARRKLSNITLEPLAPRSEMWSSLSSADVHLVPQIAAGGDSAVPSKIFSIMAAARPFIATAAEGSSLFKLAELSGAFICTPPNDPDAFADAVERLHGDSALRRRLAAAGRDYVMGYADTGAVMSRLKAFILVQTDSGTLGPMGFNKTYNEPFA